MGQPHGQQENGEKTRTRVAGHGLGWCEVEGADVVLISACAHCKSVSGGGKPAWAVAAWAEFANAGKRR
ncbi:hypothetical protein GCM10010994_24140 [Chelatococcus reniformis]|uniref:Uncharacterized protein n=1 Tax=Chelatococcus reniformis TaxID=1494448 RepID=A0A916XCY5_9HYPH|nr:hypothetical protein GCM10010994_24140 [Chelatococcus reniformis]